MKRKLLIGIAVVYVGLVIAMAILRPAFATILIGIAILGVWVYLVRTVRKKKTMMFNDQMEPELAERRLKRLKVYLLVAGISLSVGVVGTIVHNAIYGVNQTEEMVSFFFGFLGLLGCVIATIGALVVFLRGRRRRHNAMPNRVQAR